MRTDAADATSLDLGSVYSRSLRRCKTEVANWRGSITDVGKVVVASSNLHMVNDLSLEKQGALNSH